MTVRKGEGWGVPGALPDGGPIAHSDAEAARILQSARRKKRSGGRNHRVGEDPAYQNGTGGPVIGLVGGDLARTCGALGDEQRLRGPDAQQLPVDLGEVLVDGGLRYFVAHLVARHRWWRGRTVAVMNAQYLGEWDVAPRSHPNDGYLDYVEADLALGDRLKARRRLPSGTHVPHPGITTRRVRSIQLDLDPGMRLWIDGESAGPARSLSIRIVPDAWTAVV